MTEKEWEIFRGLYISLKQKFLAYRDRVRAINQGYYNGCIGSENFDPFRFNFFGNQNNINNSPIIAQYSISGWPGSPVSQYFNIEQPCNFATAGLYKNKMARFATTAQYLGTEDLDEGGCAHNTGGLGAYANIHQVCEDYVTGYTDHLADKTSASFLKECGLCPVAKDLEVVLNTFANPDNDVLLSGTGSQQVSCLTAGNPYLSFTPALDEAMFGSNDPNNFSFWTGSSNSSGTEVTGTFTKGGSSCSVNLQMVGTNMSSYTVNDIIGFCCMSYAESSASYTYTAGRNFTINAIVDDGNGGTEEVLMEGVTSCLDLLGCEPDIRVCEPTETAKQLQRLLNGLLYNTPPVTQQLFNGFADLSTGLYRHLLNNGLYHQLHQVLGSTATDLDQESLFWDASTTGGILTAWIANYSLSNCQLTMDFGSVNLANVKRIFQIEPNPLLGPNHFTAQIEVHNGTSITYEKISGSSPCLNFGTCQPSAIEAIEDTEPVDLHPHYLCFRP